MFKRLNSAESRPPALSGSSMEHEDDISYASLILLKKEVKHMMEEAVMKKIVSEEGGTVTSFCAAVEACLLHGLRKRVFGLFGSASTFGLLHKISSSCPPAASIVRMVIQLEQKYIKDQGRNGNGKSSDSSALFASKRLPSGFRYLWIRLALFEKLLACIVEFIAKNACKYYEKTSLMADPVAGIMVSALMVGPCALEYSKMKTMDHYWTDPPADELLQRHKMQSMASFRNQPTSPKTPSYSLNVKRVESLGAEELGQKVNSAARDYVMSLHQNAKSTLLYGKNNVNVFPNVKEPPIGGYLSLHQTSKGSLMVKWTPNELMNHNVSSAPVFDFEEKSTLWKYAMCLNVRDVVYLHCHNNKNNAGGSVVFVGADGVHHPPIYFPVGQHLLAFLSCLETGLLPWGQLDPPLWSQRGKGKIFPKLPRQSLSVVSQSQLLQQSQQPDPTDILSNNSSAEVDSSFDYVFRILPIAHPSSANIEDNIVLPKKYTVISSNGVTLSSSSSPKRDSTTTTTVQLSNDNSAANGTANKPSRLVKLSSFSSRLKERFLSMSSSSDNTPPHSPTATSNSSRQNSLISSPPLSPEHYFDAKTEFSPNFDQRSTSISVSSEELAYTNSPSRKSIKSVCDSMRHQIISRAFYGWLAHCRHLKTIRTHLACLVNHNIVQSDSPCDAAVGLTAESWNNLREQSDSGSLAEVYRLIYFGGIQSEIRSQVWPYLLGFYSWSRDADNGQHLDDCRVKYETLMTEWMSVEAIVRERDKEAFMAARQSRYTSGYCEIGLVENQQSFSNDVFDESDTEDGYFADSSCDNGNPAIGQQKREMYMGAICTPSAITDSRISVASHESGFVSQDSAPLTATDLTMEPLEPPSALPLRQAIDAMTSSYNDKLTPEEGDGGIYSKELVDVFGLNLHRIERDVHRCDRNYFYFTNENLEKLKNVMCTYVWERLDTGYVQGMCDLAAPLLVITNDEVLTYGCFVLLMNRMTANFAHGGGMDINLANMRSLLQAMDPEFYEFMHKNGDYTHFYFCYRWFLLDFKREFVYNDVFHVWETIWAGVHVASKNLALFLALSLMETYRDIVIDNNMDFTDIIKFFNEMAEKHDATNVIQMARDLVLRLQKAIENN